MLELTQEQCKELVKCVTEKLRITSNEKQFDDFHALVTEMAAEATITTIREYERMKSASEAVL